MALKKEIPLADGNTAEYIRFSSIKFPAIYKTGATEKVTVSFDAYRDQVACEIENRKPSTTKTYMISLEDAAGINTGMAPDEIAAYIYSKKNLFSDLSDAEDLL